MPVSVSPNGSVSTQDSRGQTIGGGRTVDGRGNAQTHVAGGPGEVRGGGFKGDINNSAVGGGFNGYSNQNSSMPRMSLGSMTPWATQSPTMGRRNPTFQRPLPPTQNDGSRWQDPMMSTMPALSPLQSAWQDPQQPYAGYAAGGPVMAQSMPMQPQQPQQPIPAPSNYAGSAPFTSRIAQRPMQPQQGQQPGAGIPNPAYANTYWGR